ncbi:hypothetical protein CJD36_018270 [Flavipsychrobacter stenotrophus]|uniref:Secretion system C-terminal sorting domain-containing protein n=1 Tax=Flavipsychrobacter stenotrophus TaxID=2077091 RepID=A0A2S7STC3_9BACT|nr:T9SS type A sorting domain-containing protein [Flavipsychrobacter stenotrophus]PQJ09871.1 hypothetical protein CJD36_018270 [Flavipsychrobacter stenotrophus]
MKKTTLLIAAIIALSFISSDLFARDWKWGAASQSEGSFLNAGLIVADHKGNTYATGILVPITVPWDMIHCDFGPYSISGGGMVVTSTDSIGNFRWVLKSRQGQIHALAIDSASNIYIFGHCSGNIVIGNDSMVSNLISSNAFCAKITSAGTVRWIKRIADTAFAFYGGVDKAGNVYVGGQYRSPAVTIGSTTLTNSGLYGTYDMFLAKLDSNGNNIWAKNIDGDSTDNILGMAVSDSGNIYIGGDYKSPTLQLDAATLALPAGETRSHLFIAKYNTSGNSVWARDIPTRSVKFLNSMTLDNYENVYLTGGYTGNIIFNNDSLPDNNSAIVHMYVASYNMNGATRWATSVVNDKYVQAWAVTTDLSGNVWVGGASTYPAWGHPMYIFRFDTAGNFTDSTFINDGGNDNSGLAVDNNNNLYICADFLSSPFYIAHDTLTLAPNAYGAMFIGRYNYEASQVSVVNVEYHTDNTRIFPNPAGSELTIETNTEVYSAYTITNAIGQMLVRRQLSNAHTNVDVSALPLGVYYLSLTGKSSRVQIFSKM